MFDMVFIRLISVLLVLGLRASLPDLLFKMVLISLLFSHYFLGFYFSKNQIKTLLTNFKFALPLFALIILSVWYIGSGYHAVYLLPFIAFHVAISETYMVNENLDSRLFSGVQFFGHVNLARFLLNLFLIILLMNSHPLFVGYSVKYYHLLITLSFIYFLSSLALLKEKIGFQKIKVFLSYELTGLALAYVLYFSHAKMTQQYFVFYHITTWLIFPSLKFFKLQKWNEIKKLTYLAIASTIFFFLIAFPFARKAPIVALDEQTAFWATVHFLSTFAISRLNPQAIRNVFYPHLKT